MGHPVVTGLFCRQLYNILSFRFNNHKSFLVRFGFQYCLGCFYAIGCNIACSM